MDPDTLEYSKCKKDQNEKWPAVTDHRQWDPGNRGDRDGHPDIHEYVGEYQRYDTDRDKASEFVGCIGSNKKAGKKQCGKCSHHGHSADKTELLRNRRKNEIGVDDGLRKEAEIYLRIGCGEPFTVESS